MDKKSIKNRLEYFWMYYKLQIVAIAIVLLLVVYFVCSALTERACALSVMLLDCHTELSDEALAEDYIRVSGLDTRKYQVEMQSSLMLEDSTSGSYAMTSLSRFLADIGSEKLDVCAMLEEDFTKYDNSKTWLDLSSCFTKEELKDLEDYLITAEDGRIIGLKADALPVFKEYGCYEDSPAGIGIIYNSQHVDEAVKYLKYLTQEEDAL